MYEEFLEQLGDFIFLSQKPEKSDVIFVPGNSYPHMAEQAARLWKEGYGSFILPSGRYSIEVGQFMENQTIKERYPGEFETEWEFLRAVLLAGGVEENAILREDKATFTYENAIYSRSVTDQADINVEKGILCCKSYHGRRALMYYQQLYPQTTFYVCSSDVDGITKENWRSTKAGIDAVLGEVRRIVEQFSLMMSFEK